MFLTAWGWRLVAYSMCAHQQAKKAFELGSLYPVDKVSLAGLPQSDDQESRGIEVMQLTSRHYLPCPEAKSYVYSIQDNVKKPPPMDFLVWPLIFLTCSRLRLLPLST
jgi:hypothetical protein